MDMDISYTNEQSNKGISMIIYGNPGVGKTSLIKTLPAEECLLVSVDAGEYVLGDIKVPKFSLKEGELDKFKEVVLWLHTEKTAFRYVFIDNMSELEKFFLLGLAEHASETGKKRENNVPIQKDWGDTSFWMRKYIRDLRNLTYKGINIIFIFWDMIIKVEDKDGSVTSQVMPMCMEKTSKEFCGLVDFVGYMGSNDKGVRYIQFDGDKMIKAKKRDLEGKILERFEQADLGRIFGKLQGGINEDK